MNLTDLQLTPGQTLELETHAPEYIDAWLEATEAQGNTLKSPTGWFLAGIRSGRDPGDPSAKRDATREKAIELAERETRNALLYCPTRTDYLDAVFGQHGRLKAWADDQPLQQRLVDLWEHEHPRGVQADKALAARGQRYQAQHATAATEKTDDDGLIEW